MADLISIWPESADFLASLHKIDDKAYRQATSNYRNLASHSISPRLGLGVTRAVVRSVEQATQMTRQPDGTYLPTPIAGKMSVRYDFGGTEPLDMEDARAANLEQYRRARGVLRELSNSLVRRVSVPASGAAKELTSSCLWLNR